MERKTALVTGGSGYIGSHLAKKLKREGWEVIIIDLVAPTHKYYDTYLVYDLKSIKLFEKVLCLFEFDAVFHLAARIEVGLSKEQAIDFWLNNVGATINLLSAMKKSNTNNIIFASSAAVYKPLKYSLHENYETAKNSVYGSTKLACENAIQDSGLNYINLRFFNVAGADHEGELKENHKVKTHLIPLLIKNKDDFKVFGDDFDTDDGTCVRDYVHVDDVADACICAYNCLESKTRVKGTFNIGSGKPSSVIDIIETFEDFTNTRIKYKIVERRDGDPDILVANISMAKRWLNWSPKYKLSDIILDATLDN